MIRQLQKRFIRIAVISLTVAMVLVVGIVNIANWISVRNELASTLNLLAENETDRQEWTGTAEGRKDLPNLPEENPEKQEQAEEKSEDTKVPFPGPSRHFRNMMAESNWFSALISENGEVERLMLARIENLEEEPARELVRQILAGGQTEGYIQDYLYRVIPWRDGKKEILVLNCETRLATMRKLILISAIACAGGILLALLLVMLSSRKAIEPVVRNMEQQKQFITNASHELKTPLTVIATNMELLQMETEDNPWVRSTLKQTGMMSKLVDELVYLSRMEEEHPTLETETFDAGKLLEETAEPFVSMAEFSGREMRVTAEKDLRMTADKASIQRLMSTLCDNAVKYASDGPIAAEIRGEGRNIILQVSNPVEEPLTKEQCEQLFNRFYRVDSSRTKGKKGGFGIGLAIAAAIAEKHGGRMTAAMEGNRLVFTGLLPREAKK